MKSAVAARGAVTTLGGQLLKYLIQLLALVFLARLLTPEDYGLVAMVTAVVGIAMVIGDFGLGLSAVQAKELTSPQRDNLFWVNGLVGVLTGLAIFSLGPSLAVFYDEPKLQAITAVLSVTFVLNGLASQFRAELVRGLKFVPLATVDLTAQIVSFALAIVGAVMGVGYWALVLQQVTFAAVTLGGLVVASGWFPGRPRRNAKMGSLYSFGASTFATQVINYVSSNVDSIALGRFLGSAEVGIYNRAFQIFSLPLQQLAAPLTRVALPVLSRITDEAQFKRYVHRMQLVLSYCLVGLLAFVASTSAPLLTVVLGSQWVAGAPILEVLCLGGAFQALGYIYYWMFLARAKMSILLCCEAVGRGAMICLIFIAAPNGAVWVAAAVACGLFITWLMTTIFGLPRLGFERKSLLGIALPPASIFLGMYVACKIVASASPFNDLSAPELLAVLSCICLLALTLALFFRPIRRDITSIYETVKMAAVRS